MPSPSRDPTHVAILIYDGLCGFEYAITIETLARTRPRDAKEWYRVQTCAETREVSSATPGVHLVADTSLRGLSRAGTIIVPGWDLRAPTPSDALRRALLRAHRDGARLISICTGAFLLAEIGVLDPYPATTHWLHAEAFRTRYPHINLQTDVLYIDNDDVMTSAGSAAGLDLILHLIAKDFGAAPANEVARRLVVQPQRAGGQQQFIDAPMPSAQSAPTIAPLLEKVRGSLADSWTVDAMATETAMSPRTLAQRFEETLGLSPGHWLLQERLRAARIMLETSHTKLDDIAAAVGLGGAENFIRRFRDHVGLTPAAYRKTFVGHQQS